VFDLDLVVMLVRDLRDVVDAIIFARRSVVLQRIDAVDKRHGAGIQFRLRDLVLAELFSGKGLPVEGSLIDVVKMAAR
jgi:hypothetical protein